MAEWGLLSIEPETEGIQGLQSEAHTEGGQDCGALGHCQLTQFSPPRRGSSAVAQQCLRCTRQCSRTTDIQ